MSALSTLIEEVEALILGCQTASTAESDIKDLVAAKPHDVDVPAVIKVLDTLTFQQTWSVLGNLALAEYNAQLSFLDSIVSAAKKYVDLDPRPLATMVARQLARVGREIHHEAIDAVVELTKLLVKVEDGTLLPMLRRMGVQSESEFLSVFKAHAMQAGLLPLDADALNRIGNLKFGDFVLTQGRSYWSYIGMDVHSQIGRFYAEAHLLHASGLWLNYFPVDTIVNELVGLYPEFDPIQLRRTLGRSKPDIYELALDAHPGLLPGIVYEIKPYPDTAGAALIAAEDSMAFSTSGIPSQPGPMGLPGTSGVVGAPNGWATFDALQPGAITYKFYLAPKVEIAARDKARGRDTQKGEYFDQLAALNIDPKLVPLVALVLAALAAGGAMILLT